ncbi:MAG: DEAD/DEAH box helicase [Deltaproteobacteria bacterium]|nr:DEAD/DEAH box helicase [Deltaproteobacteria bacterium]
MVQRLAQSNGRGLVLVPTRELALQVNETFLKIAPQFGMKTVVLIGGASMHNQIQDLKRKPRIIIATPGRLMDHLKRKYVNLGDVSVLVLDEADRMLDMGFAPQIREILHHVPKERQTMLFSATMPSEIVQVANSHMKLPIRAEIAPTGTAAEGIVQELFIVRKDSKLKLLSKILNEYHGSVLLFTRTKIGAKKVVRAIWDMHHRAAEIHSDRSLGQRREALQGFKTGKYRVLVATDIASRGIDVIGIELVINFDLPEDAESYVHRIGRTGRAGKEGHAIAFATPDQGKDVKNIERLIRSTLRISEHPEMPKESFIKQAAPRIGFIGRRGRRSHFRSRPGIRH